MQRVTLSWRFTILIVSLSLLLSLTALWGINKQTLGLFHDDAIYAAVAKSIYQGEGYRIASLPSAPQQTKYPFLYSYLIAGLWALAPEFPQNIALLKALNCVLLGIIFGLCAVLYRRYFPRATVGAIVFGLIVCANPIIFTFTDYVVSDLLLVALALGSLCLCSPSPGRVSPARVSLLGLVAGLACLTRLAAAPLAFAGAAWVFFERGWRAALGFCFIASLVIIPWLVWVYLNTDHSTNPLFAYYRAYDFSPGDAASWSGWIVDSWPIVAGNARYLLGSLDLLYLLPLMPWLTPVVATFTLVGIFASVRRQDLFPSMFLVGSLVLLLVWPFHPSRYVAPLIPLLVLFLFRGMAATEGRIQIYQGKYPIAYLAKKVAWLPVVFILILEGVWLSSFLLVRDDQSTRGIYGRRLSYGWSGFEESFGWIRANTDKDALVATAYDPMYYLYTGRRAIRPAVHRSATYFYPYGEAVPEVGSAPEVKGALDELGADYLIFDPMDGYAEGKATQKLLSELVDEYGKSATLVFTSTDGKHRIYALARNSISGRR